MPLGSAPPTCFDCGPAPAYPTGSCPDGVHISGRGPCTKFADGSCRWTDLVCPPALRPAAILLIGMLAAKGSSKLRNIYSIKRGYENIAERLQGLGAKVEVFNE